MAKTMMDKNKQDDVGACFKELEALEEDVSKLTRMMMEKSKEDDMGACIEKLDKIGWAVQDPMENVGDTLEQILNVEGHAWKHNCVDSMGQLFHCRRFSLGSVILASCSKECSFPYLCLGVVSPELIDERLHPKLMLKH
nr:L10-interacting MYB domain-containing protein-like [Tanacetum cinerariifolium]